MQSVHREERCHLRHGAFVSSGCGLNRHHPDNIVLAGVDIDDSSQGRLTGNQTILLQQDDISDLSVSTRGVPLGELPQTGDVVGRPPPPEVSGECLL